MKFSRYQEEAWSTAMYPNMGSNLIYPALGLVGEAGEVAEKVKKLWRNEGKTKGESLSDQECLELSKEIGDVLWYCAAMAQEIGLDLDFIADQNISKLQSRKERNVIKAQGDNR